MSSSATRLTWRILRANGKSFAWAARLLPASCRRDAAALYAWCRRCDDAVDLPSNPLVAARAVVRLRAELARVYGGAPLADPVLAAFAEVVRRHAIPRAHAEDLVNGMEMDVGPVRYATYDELLVYCYRVAGTVGLMMAHVMGVRDARALGRAAELGMAMQLTNICRDVAEDRARDRVYLPAELLGDGPAPAVAELLTRAERLYGAGDRGLAALPARCALAVRAARLIYSDLGRVIATRGYDVSAPRAFVTGPRKLWLAARAVLEALGRALRGRAPE